MIGVSSFAIKDVNFENLNDLVSLYYRSFQGSVSLSGVEESEVLEIVQDICYRPGFIGKSIWHEDKPVGAFLAYSVSDGFGLDVDFSLLHWKLEELGLIDGIYLSKLFVDPDYHGQGLGKSLVGMLKSEHLGKPLLFRAKDKYTRESKNNTLLIVSKNYHMIPVKLFVDPKHEELVWYLVLNQFSDKLTEQIQAYKGGDKKIC